MRGIASNALAGALPDNPHKWFLQQVEQQQFELRKYFPLLLHRLDHPPLPGSALRSKWQQAVAKRDLIHVLERASSLVAGARLGPTDVAAMLSQAAAPHTVDPAAIVQLAADCLIVAMRHRQFVRVAEDWEQYKLTWRAAKATHTKFRQLLPLLTGIMQQLDGGPLAYSSDRTVQFRMFGQELEKLDFSEPDIPLDFPVPSRWHQGAVRLAKSYRETINPKAGWSRTGPAVRFLAEALRRAYPEGKITGAAIEQHLNGHRHDQLI